MQALLRCNYGWMFNKSMRFSFRAYALATKVQVLFQHLYFATGLTLQLWFCNGNKKRFVWFPPKHNSSQMKSWFDGLGDLGLKGFLPIARRWTCRSKSRIVPGTQTKTLDTIWTFTSAKGGYLANRCLSGNNTEIRQTLSTLQCWY